jgi:release factor glutamine methyltransferase
MSSGTYLSSDDSVLLRSALGRYSGEACLEIGAGNGGGLIALAKSYGLTVGTDIQRPSDSSWRGDSVDFVLADAASCFRERSFELVAFNPPYLPSDGLEERTVDGGEGGVAVASHFLAQAMRVTKENGRIVVLLSSESVLAPIRRICDLNGFLMKHLESKHLFYENLSVYEISRRGESRP